MDQGDPVGDVGALAPSQPWMTPLRALLILLAAVLGGVALSVILGSSPAHAADGVGGGSDTPVGSVATVTRSLVGTASRAIDAGIPLVQHSVGAAGDSVATHVPVSAPIVAPITASVEATLAVVQQVVAPTIRPVPAIASLLLAAPAEHAAASAVGGTALLTAAASANSAVGTLAAPQNGTGSDGALPGPVLTGASGSPAAALGVVVGALTLTLLGARRRGHDETPPASPTFELDTSPA